MGLGEAHASEEGLKEDLVTALRWKNFQNFFGVLLALEGFFQFLEDF